MTDAGLRVFIALCPPPSCDDVVWLNARDFTVARGGVAVRLPPKQWRIAAVYLASEAAISTSDFVEAFWSDDPDGGPDNPANVISVHLTIANKSLRQIGIKIATKSGHGSQPRYVSDLWGARS